MARALVEGAVTWVEGVELRTSERVRALRDGRRPSMFTVERLGEEGKWEAVEGGECDHLGEAELLARTRRRQDGAVYRVQGGRENKPIVYIGEAYMDLFDRLRQFRLSVAVAVSKGAVGRVPPLGSLLAEGRAAVGEWLAAQEGQHWGGKTRIYFGVPEEIWSVFESELEGKSSEVAFLAESLECATLGATKGRFLEWLGSWCRWFRERN